MLLSSHERFGLDRRITLLGPLPLDCGAALAPVQIAYETYGTLVPDGGNAVLICHALTGDQHVASTHPRTGKPVDVSAPLPPHMAQSWNLLGFDAARYDPIVEAPEA